MLLLLCVGFVLLRMCMCVCVCAHDTESSIFIACYRAFTHIHCWYGRKMGGGSLRVLLLLLLLLLLMRVVRFWCAAAHQMDRAAALAPTPTHTHPKSPHACAHAVTLYTTNLNLWLVYLRTSRRTTHTIRRVDVGEGGVSRARHTSIHTDHMRSFVCVCVCVLGVWKSSVSCSVLPLCRSIIHTFAARARSLTYVCGGVFITSAFRSAPGSRSPASNTHMHTPPPNTRKSRAFIFYASAHNREQIIVFGV